MTIIEDPDWTLGVTRHHHPHRYQWTLTNHATGRTLVGIRATQAEAERDARIVLRRHTALAAIEADAS